MGAAGHDSDLRYVKHTPAGAEYVQQINAQEADRRTRDAFRELVLRVAAPGARLFDFGAGPGIDAVFFAERGFTIDAYEVDPRMRTYFTEHCRDPMATERITLDGRPYREFLAAAGAGPHSDLVISNFAPLNLIDDLRELFVKFHQLTTPQAKILASVLNPFFLGEVRHRGWWRGAPRLWRDGQLFLPGPQAPHYRRRLRHFHAVSAPHFQLTGVHGSIRSRYLFLLFDKTPRP